MVKRDRWRRWTMLALMPGGGCKQCFAQKKIEYDAVKFNGGARLPAGLFDSVADNNLLHNALIKQLSESGVQISVSISPDAKTLRVSDSGSARTRISRRKLFQAPVASESGFGIGLFNAASQAESLGYSLSLSSNIQGKVCFELSKRSDTKKGRPQAALVWGLKRLRRT